MRTPMTKTKCLLTKMLELESKDSNFYVDLVDESFEQDSGLIKWCMRPESFAPRIMDIDELVAYYRKSSWNSASV